MKILFLDIDGVVNCATTSQRHRGCIGIDPYMTLLVDRIIQATGVKVVLSSNWRKANLFRKEVREQVCTFIAVTPGSASGQRGLEIQAWLDNQEIEQVEKYAILDDDSDMLEEQMPNFFKTEWQTGLTQEIADKVIQHLNSV